MMHHPRLLMLRQRILIRLLLLVLRRSLRDRQRALISLMRVDRQRVLVLVVHLRAVVVDGASGHGVELVVGDGRAALGRDTVHLVDFLLAGGGGEAAADFAGDYFPAVVVVFFVG
jgi:hypothetical protein